MPCSFARSALRVAVPSVVSAVLVAAALTVLGPSSSAGRVSLADLAGHPGCSAWASRLVSFPSIGRSQRWRAMASSVGYASAVMAGRGVLWRMSWRVDTTGIRSTQAWILDAFDTRDPVAPRLATRLVGGTGSAIFAMDGLRAVVASASWVGTGWGRHWLSVLDTSDLMAPRVAAQIPLDEAPLSAAAHGMFAWVVLRSPAGGDVGVFDIAEPGSPRSIGTWGDSWDQVVAMNDGLMLRRGTEVAWADYGDPLAPRVRSRAVIDEVVAIARSDQLGLYLIDSASSEPQTNARVVQGDDVGAFAWDGQTIAVARGAALGLYAHAPDGTALLWAEIDLEAPAEALLVDHGRVYVLGGGAIDVVDLTGDVPRRVARAAAPFGVRSLAIAGDRLLAALGSGGLAAWRLSAPDRPVVLTRCGTTLQGARTVDVSAAGATTVTLRVDGIAVGEAVASRRCARRRRTGRAARSGRRSHRSLRCRPRPRSPRSRGRRDGLGAAGAHQRAGPPDRRPDAGRRPHGHDVRRPLVKGLGGTLCS